MSKTKHTSGPWCVQRGQNLGYHGQQLFNVHVGGDANYGNCIAIVYHGGGGATRIDEASLEANARLIASAPDLLAICESTADALEENDPDLSLYWLAERLRAVIVKARGATN